jgi:hypothetical protein
VERTTCCTRRRTSLPSRWRRPSKVLSSRAAIPIDGHGHGSCSMRSAPSRTASLRRSVRRGLPERRRGDGRCRATPTPTDARPPHRGHRASALTPALHPQPRRCGAPRRPHHRREDPTDLNVLAASALPDGADAAPRSRSSAPVRRSPPRPFGDLGEQRVDGLTEARQPVTDPFAVARPGGLVVDRGWDRIHGTDPADAPSGQLRSSTRSQNAGRSQASSTVASSASSSCHASRSSR